MPRASSSFVFSCSSANSWLQHVGSSSLTRDRTPGPMHWKQGVLVTGPPGKSLLPFLTSHLLSSPITPQQPHWSLLFFKHQAQSILRACALANLCLEHSYQISVWLALHFLWLPALSDLLSEVLPDHPTHLAYPSSPYAHYSALFLPVALIMISCYTFNSLFLSISY